MKTKAAPCQVKAADERDGTFTALVSVFNNVDHAGDRVMPGAFTDSLKQWEESGNPLPVIWSHDWSNPHAHIGKVTKARETSDGLLVDAQLDLDRPFAEQVHHLLRERRVTQFSFGYDVIDERRGKDGANELLKVHAHEVGPTLLGMNAETQLIAAKARRRKAALGPAAVRSHLDSIAGDVPDLGDLQTLAKGIDPDLSPTGVALLARILELED